jgi:hypothetical protein
VERILAACADYDINVDTGRRVRGNTVVNQWQEDWVFYRASTAVTKPDGGIRSQKCPNCGAPLDMDMTGTYKCCQAPIMSGRLRLGRNPHRPSSGLLLA